MNRGALTVFAVILGVAALVAYLTLFTVSQTQQALVLEFGKPKRVITDPGLQYKIPFIQNVEFFDKRILDIDTASQEVIASDKKRLVVDAFARYRIMDPLLFFQTLRDERIASARIGAIIEASLRRVLGGSSFTAVVRDKRESLMRTIAGQVNQEATPFGVKIVDVRIKRVDLPEANMQAIYRRMQTERQREAAEFRAEGEGAARRIRATADREVTVIKAEATGESERNYSNISTTPSAARFRTRRLRPPVPPTRRTRPRGIPEGRSRGARGRARRFPSPTPRPATPLLRRRRPREAGGRT